MQMLRRCYAEIIAQKLAVRRSLQKFSPSESPVRQKVQAALRRQGSDRAATGQTAGEEPPDDFEFISLDYPEQKKC